MEAATRTLKEIDINKGSVFDQPIEDLLIITRQPMTDSNTQDKNDYCLVTLDVRNTWTVPFDVEFEIDNSNADDNDTQNDDDQKKENPPLKSIVTVQPGSTKRMALPVKRLFLPPNVCTQPIPSLEPNKQFVVSQVPKMPPEQERARLQMFWYREALLRRVKATWKCRSTRRHGILNLRSSLRLTSLQLSILKKEDIGFNVDIQGETVKKISHRRFQCECNEFVTMHVSIRNRNGTYFLSAYSARVQAAKPAL